MANPFLNREDAPIGSATWDFLSEQMVEIARTQLSGRRLLDVEGPYGLGLKTVPLGEEEVSEGVSVSRSLPLAYLVRTFTLSTRDLASYEAETVNLDTNPLFEATQQECSLEDQTIFFGSGELPGLTSAKGIHHRKLSAWDAVGQALEDLVQAVTLLDGAGYHGPYRLALAPQRYNLLFRIYPQAPITELEHLQQLVSGGIVKAPALQKGGVLLNAGAQYAALILGQDMQLGFIGPSEDKLEFSVSESLALLVRQPKSVCVLDE